MDRILALRQQGVPNAVLNAMLTSGKATVAPVPAPAPVALPPQQISNLPQPQTPPPVMVPQPAANPDVAYFYQELSPYGRWLLAEDNQWFWQPTVGLSTAAWRPYWDNGHWVYTDHGWYWASDYPWGWAAFHYGRWQLHPHHGWMWHPDRVWGPAWVVWRSGGEYCGWAPLPPGAVYDTAAARFLWNGRHVEVGFDFGLSWNRFSFCYAREMGEQPRMHFRQETEIRSVYNRTAVIHSYAVNRVLVGGVTQVQIVNHGIEPARVGVGRSRPVETVRIQEMHTPPPNRGHERLDPHSKTLEVYRPKFSGGH